MLTWVLDQRGTIIFRSQEWADYTGIHESDLRSRLRSQAIHPDDFGRVERTVDESVAMQIPFLITYRLKRADQTFGWVVTGGSPSFSSVDGALIGYLGTTTEHHPPIGIAHADRHRAIIVLDSIAAQIMTVRNLAKQNTHGAIAKVLDLALLLTGRLLTQEIQRH